MAKGLLSEKTVNSETDIMYPGQDYYCKANKDHYYNFECKGGSKQVSCEVSKFVFYLFKIHRDWLTKFNTVVEPIPFTTIFIYRMLEFAVTRK